MEELEALNCMRGDVENGCQGETLVRKRATVKEKRDCQRREAKT